ncbi:GTPase ObgE [Blattabacterium cuenoti]|uniref:GTPase ObgE n=1 Tax=Blattabacterium cuenoti TaxID=1653831 RepID=UPI00163C411A|nr:GTPase ObgE [Blattabacterium cuenoti]
MKNDFIDFIKIFCKSGDGGSGYVSFYKNKFFMKKKSSRGSGGNGGHIFIKGNSNINNFFHLRYHKHWIAQSGKPGGKNNKNGSNGKNLLIEVPLGTIVKDSSNNKIVEFIKSSTKKMLFKGGQGGKGINFFSYKKKNHACSSIKNGIKTKGKWITLELKILADIGIIGLPNVGKSSLLSVITNAKPKIGAYSFTNIRPILGVIKKNFDNFTIADIPGIIKNSSKGRGLGINFLRHIERNSVLLFLISPEKRNEKEQYLMLLNELGNFNSNLLKKQRLLAISKSDLIDNDNLKKDISYKFSKLNEDIIFISSLKKEGIKELIDKLYNLIKKKKAY